MATPVIAIGRLTFKGRSLNIEAAVDFKGDTGTVDYYLDPVPVGTSLGPSPLTVVGANISQKINVGNGRWKLRLVATASDATTAEVSSAIVTVNRLRGRVVMPLIGGEPTTSAAKPNVLEMGDWAFRYAYGNAIKGAPAGSKRNAGATQIKGILGGKMRLDIYRDKTLVVRAEYGQSMDIINDGTQIALKLRMPTKASVLASADLETGNWRFELQGGVNFTRILRGRVGPGNPGDHLALSASPIAGTGFDASDLAIVLPRAIDNLT